jgi:predicted PurR-regulated permease PerM
VLILIIVPIIVFILFLGRQAYDTYGYVQHQVQTGALDPFIKWQKGGLIYDGLGIVREQLGSVVDLSSIDLKKNITDTAQFMAGFLAKQSASLIAGLGWVILSFFILIFAMYYFFKDAEQLKKKLMIISPLPLVYEKEIIKKFKEMSLATLYGMFLTSIAQGIIGGIGFAIVGIPNVIFWGTAIAVFSVVPVLGTSIIWFPASVILFATGNVFGGIFLFFWGILIVSTIDNFLRAFLIGGTTKTNQLLTFLAVFGGIGLFGLIGVIYGPLILTLFLTLLHVYEMEYDGVLQNGK